MEQQRFVLLTTVGGAWVIRDTRDGSPVCVLFHGGRGMKKTRAMAEVMLDVLRECPAYILLYQFSPKDTGQSKVK